METSVQNGLMAAVYALLFLCCLRKPIRFWGLLVGAAVSCFINVGYDTFIHFRWTMSLALLFRMLPAVEACYLSIRHLPSRRALAALMAALTWACLCPNAIAYGYLRVRSMAEIGVFLVCLFCVAAQNGDNTPIVAGNLCLQTAWFALHVVFSLSAPWYNQSWERRGVARWLYILAAMAVVDAYRRLFMNSRARLEASTAGRRRQ